MRQAQAQYLANFVASGQTSDQKKPSPLLPQAKSYSKIKYEDDITEKHDSKNSSDDENDVNAIHCWYKNCSKGASKLLLFPRFVYCFYILI